MNCPSILELTSPGRIAATEEHIASCLRCSALLRAWQQDLTDEVEERVEGDVAGFEPRAHPEAGPRLGAVHTIAAPDQDLYLLGLVIDLTEHEATVFPLSTEVHWAGDWDFPLDISRLGYEAMVTAWNPIDVLTDQVKEQVASFDDGHLWIELYDRALAGRPPPSALADGPPLQGGSDPRQLFRERERERFLTYAEPARILNAGQNLGQVVGARRQELDREVDELAAALDIEPLRLSRLEAGTEDLWEGVPVARFSDLVRELELPKSERLYALTEEAVFESDRSGGDLKPALARRRRGLRSKRRPQASVEERRERARTWVKQLREALGD